MLRHNYTITRDGKLIHQQGRGACYADLRSFRMLPGDKLLIQEPLVPLPENMTPEVYIDYCRGVTQGYFNMESISCTPTADGEFSITLEMTSLMEMKYHQFLNPMTALRTPMEFPSMSMMISPFMEMLGHVFDPPLKQINAMILACALPRYSQAIFPGQGGHICVTSVQSFGMVMNHDSYLQSKAMSVNGIYIPCKTNPYLSEIPSVFMQSYVDTIGPQLTSLKKECTDLVKKRIKGADIMASALPMLFPDRLKGFEGVMFDTLNFFDSYTVVKCDSDPELAGKTIYYGDGCSSAFGNLETSFSLSKDAAALRTVVRGLAVAKK